MYEGTIISTPQGRFRIVQASSTSTSSNLDKSSMAPEQMSMWRRQLTEMSLATCPHADCSISYLSLAGIVSHYKTCNGMSSDYVNCEFCGAKLKNYKYLQSHQKKVHFKSINMTMPGNQHDPSNPILEEKIVVMRDYCLPPYSLKPDTQSPITLGKPIYNVDLDEKREDTETAEQKGNRLMLESRMISTPRRRGRPCKYGKPEVRVDKTNMQYSDPFDIGKPSLQAVPSEGNLLQGHYVTTTPHRHKIIESSQQQQTGTSNESSLPANSPSVQGLESPKANSNHSKDLALSESWKQIQAPSSEKVQNESELEARERSLIEAEEKLAEFEMIVKESEREAMEVARKARIKQWENRLAKKKDELEKRHQRALQLKQSVLSNIEDQGPPNVTDPTPTHGNFCQTTETETSIADTVVIIQDQLEQIDVANTIDISDHISIPESFRKECIVHTVSDISRAKNVCNVSSANEQECASSSVLEVSNVPDLSTNPEPDDLVEENIVVLDVPQSIQNSEDITSSGQKTEIISNNNPGTDVVSSNVKEKNFLQTERHQQQSLGEENNTNIFVEESDNSQSDLTPTKMNSQPIIDPPPLDKVQVTDTTQRIIPESRQLETQEEIKAGKTEECTANSETKEILQMGADKEGCKVLQESVAGPNDPNQGGEPMDQIEKPLPKKRGRPRKKTARTVKQKRPVPSVSKAAHHDDSKPPPKKRGRKSKAEMLMLAAKREKEEAEKRAEEEREALEEQNQMDLESGGRRRRRAAFRATKRLSEALDLLKRDEHGQKIEERTDIDTESSDDEAVNEMNVEEHYKKTKKSIICKWCKERFKSVKLVQSHVVTEHSNVLTKDYEDDDYESEASEALEPESEVSDVGMDCDYIKAAPRIKKACGSPKKDHGPNCDMARLELEFRVENYNKNDFQSFGTHMADWIKIVGDEVEPYLSLENSSLSFVTEGKEPGLDSRNLQRFASIQDVDGNLILYAGGPICTSSWCPSYSKSSSDFLALAADSDFEKTHTISDPSLGKGLIQFYQVDIKNSSEVSAKFCLGLVHEFGKIWDMQWCPSLKKTPDNEGLEVIGLLAVACSDAAIRMFSLPHPDAFHCEGPIFVKSEAKKTLVLGNVTVAKCLCLSWYKGENHRVIGGGFSDGTFALWDIMADQQNGSNQNGNDKIFPYVHIFAHNTAITSMDIKPVTGQEFPDYVATAGIDRILNIWDLNQQSSPMVVIKKGLVRKVSWMSHSLHRVIVSYDDAYSQSNTKTSIIDLENIMHLPGSKMHFNVLSLIPQESCVWCHDYNPLLHTLTVGSNAGELIFHSMQELDKSWKEKGQKSQRNCLLASTVKVSSDHTDNKTSEEFFEDGDYFKIKQNLTLKLCSYPFTASGNTPFKVPVKEDFLSYPILGINTVSHSNKNHNFIFSGGQSGIGRILNLPYLSNIAKQKVGV